MLVTLAWLWALTLPHPGMIESTAPDHRTGGDHRAAGNIRVWTDRERPYRRGEEARIYFRTDRPAYVTVLRVDTDGRIRILFPRQPWGRTYVRGGRTLEAAVSRDRGAFTVQDYPGIGYVFAVASASPFRYDEITRGDYWDFRLVGAGRIRGDPYVALTDLAARIAPRSGYRYDIAPYYVEQRYAFPRFVCYDCHSYAGYEEWNPYATRCARFRVVIHDDPAYYPYRYNQGRSVVAERPIRPAPRYVFKDAEPGTEYVTRVRKGQADPTPGRRADRGRTSADVGGPGAVPAPGMFPAGGETQRRPERRQLLRAGDRDAEVGDRPTEGRGHAEEIPPVQRGARNPQSTGEPELRRRKPDRR
jgi:hypothetical protein